MKTFFKLIVPAAMILLFSYAATSKLADFATFRDQLYRQPFSNALADVLSYIIPFTELLAVVLLLFKRSIFTGLLLSVALLTIFSIYISLGLLHFWGKIPCSCGGILSHMSWGTHLLLNAGCLLAGIGGLYEHYPIKKHELDSTIRQHLQG